VLHYGDWFLSGKGDDGIWNDCELWLLLPHGLPIGERRIAKRGQAAKRGPGRKGCPRASARHGGPGHESRLFYLSFVLRGRKEGRLISWLRSEDGDTHVILRWPQSSRMQYEEIKSKKHRVKRNAFSTATPNEKKIVSSAHPGTQKAVLLAIFTLLVSAQSQCSWDCQRKCHEGAFGWIAAHRGP
jgi:hypothetical protein